jgi:O-acetyl-ADP-ribose deacetylase (regulator of RNase III)
VGPIWSGGILGEDKILATCYYNCLNELYKSGLPSISFPAISTGIYRFPKEEAATIALKVIFEQITGPLKDVFSEIRFVLFSKEDWYIYLEALKLLIPEKNDFLAMPKS